MCAVRVLRASETRAVRRVRRGAPPDHHGHSPWVEVELPAPFSAVLQVALSEVMKVCPSLKLKVFVEDITVFMEGRNKELAGVAERVLRAMRV